MKCIICGREALYETKCEYCYYTNVHAKSYPEGFIESQRKKHKACELYKTSPCYRDEYKTSPSYRDDLISNVQLVINRYIWNPDNKELVRKEDKIFLVNSGNDIYLTPFWSEPLIAQLTDVSSNKIKINIEYNSNGKQKNSLFEMETPKGCNDFLQVGIELDKNNCLILYLGDKENDNYVKSSPLKIDIDSNSGKKIQK